MISDVADRRVRHINLSVAALVRRHEGFGLPADDAALLAGTDGQIADGAEDRTTREVEVLTGPQPTSLNTFLLGIGTYLDLVHRRRMPHEG